MYVSGSTNSGYIATRYGLVGYSAAGNYPGHVTATMLDWYNGGKGGRPPLTFQFANDAGANAAGQPLIICNNENCQTYLLCADGTITLRQDPQTQLFWPVKS